MALRCMLECCVDSVESAVNARLGGADRLELCTALSVGGLTPGLPLFRRVKQEAGLPIRVLLRPRSGDFLYTQREFDLLLDEAAQFRAAGAGGLVFGFLTPEGRLDLEKMSAMVREAGPLEKTLHRAFDMCADPIEAMEQAKALGIGCILTSGQAESCARGAPLLKKLAARADGIEIMAGGGVNAQTADMLLRTAGIRSVHLSGKAAVQSGMRYRNARVSMGAAQGEEYFIWRTDRTAIEEVRAVLDRFELESCDGRNTKLEGKG